MDGFRDRISVEDVAIADIPPFFVDKGFRDQSFLVLYTYIHTSIGGQEGRKHSFWDFNHSTSGGMQVLSVLKESFFWPFCLEIDDST